ncbi:hypothetical protein LNV08_11805 [Paucibacter sp. TC2R-5]|uniref:hypothetical protein n=1 Tax=Paucibacter sp. TC2R-5 TaxID=2893555 RepID=UPI0021E49576|nr:hypothetical protein [Paucibacter sp. TC2R-5]MCV2359654.1 hypothetical protein [Paucibacter sp. TC2R-5]
MSTKAGAIVMRVAGGGSRDGLQRGLVCGSFGGPVTATLGIDGAAVGQFGRRGGV